MSNLTVVKERKEQSSRRTMFLVPFTISGKLQVWARNETEAALKFAQVDVRDLAEHGKLRGFNPEKE